VALAGFLLTLVFAPFDFPAERIVSAHGQLAAGAVTGLTPGSAAALVQSGAFEHAALVAEGRPQLLSDGEPRQLSAAHVGEEFFDVFPVSGPIGSPSALRAHERGVVISYRLWQALGAPADIVGRELRLDDGIDDIVAVAPQGFNIPVGTDVWRRLRIDRQSLRDIGPGPYGVYLTRHGSIEQARAATAVASAGRGQVGGFSIGLIPLRDDVGMAYTGTTRFLVWSGVILITVTLSNLYLLSAARARRCAGVQAIHTALGAGRPVLVARILAEVVTITAIGSTGAVLVAMWLTEWLWTAAPAYLTAVRTTPVYLPLLQCSSVALAFSAVVVALGMIPATRVQEGRYIAAVGRLTPRRGRFRAHLLVGLQLAIAAAVGATTVTLVRAYVIENTAANLVSSAGVLSLDIIPSVRRYRSPAERGTLYRHILTMLRAESSLLNASIVSYAPFGSLSPPLVVVSRQDMSSVSASACILEVTDGFSNVLKLSLQPRLTTDVTTPGSAVITASLARALYGEQSPLGRILALGRGRTARVAAVAEDVELGFRRRPSGFVFVTVAPEDLRGAAAHILVSHPSGRIDEAMTAVRAAVRLADPQQPVTRLQTLDAAISSTRRAPRFLMTVFLFVAILSVLVAGVGVAAMQSYSLVSRRSEFALCVALGASPYRLVRYCVSALAASVVGAGLVGTGLSIVGAKIVSPLSGARAYSTDIPVGLAIMTAVALLASVPSIVRVLRVDPRELLNAE
jgi:hypothetical protein